jgi:hypothetical protein
MKLVVTGQREEALSKAFAVLGEAGFEPKFHPLYGTSSERSVMISIKLKEDEVKSGKENKMG